MRNCDVWMHSLESGCPRCGGYVFAGSVASLFAHVSHADTLHLRRQVAQASLKWG